MRGSNRGNHKCFNCGDEIDGKVFYETDAYGEAAFCEECHAEEDADDEDDPFLEDYNREVMMLVISRFSRWWMSPQCAAMRGIGGTGATPVVLVKQ
jgi:hypothetical protein